MTDSYIYIIIVLLPIVSLTLVFQVNPYNALIMRAILGAVAALVYAVLGAADVSLTEALVGTMLAITLYVIAVRSSLVMRLGILEESEEEKESLFEEIIAQLRKQIKKYHLRLELVEYPNVQDLQQALKNKEIHATCTTTESVENNDTKEYNTTIRVHRLFEILNTELISPLTTLNYITLSTKEDQH